LGNVGREELERNYEEDDRTQKDDEVEEEIP
jgi:hypothetical protein